MRSKTSFFNPTLFKKNLARFWPLWGGASLIGALFPLAMLTVLIREGELLHRISDPLEVTALYYQVVAWIIPILSLLYAPLCALAAWGWLYNPRSVGMYHSLPITRKSLFVTDLLSGMAMMLIPYAVTGSLTVLVTTAVGGLEPVGLAVTILSVLGQSLFFFASATAVVFITGNPFAFAGFYFIFHFIAAGAEWMVTRLMTMFYFGVQRSYEGVVEFLSPVMYLTRKLEVDGEFHQIPTADGWIENGDLESVTLVNGWLIAVYALAGVVLLGLAWALYRRRRSESAGDVVSVGWMKPVFRYGVAICAAFTGGMALYSLFFNDLQTRLTADALPMAVCMAAAGLAGYYIASMLLAKSLSVFRGSWKGALATLIAAGALCFVLAADPLGMETWVPEEDGVTGVTLWLSTWNGRSLNVHVNDPAAIRQILDAHRAITAERDTLEQKRPLGEEEVYSVDLYLTYFQGDQDIWRYYQIRCSQALMAQSEALQKLADLACAPAIQEHDIFSNILREDVETRITGGYLSKLYNTETGEREDLDLTPEQARTLEAAIRRDIQAGHFGRTLFYPLKEYYNSAYGGSLELNYAVTYTESQYAGERYNDSVSLSLSVYCTETLKALEDLGVTGGSRRLLTLAEHEALNNGEKGLPYEGDYDPDSFPDTSSIVYPGDRFVYAENAYEEGPY